MVNLMPDPTPITVEEAEAVFGEGFLRGRPSIPTEVVVLESGPLTEEDVFAANAHAESGEVLGVTNPDLQNIRAIHHRLAQFAGMGMKDVDISRICGISPTRISILRNTPAFMDLIEHYKGVVADGFQDFVEAAGELSTAAVEELKARLEANPAGFTNTQLVEMFKGAADRSGNAPVAKSFNVNLNAGIGDKLEAARRRAAQAYIESQPHTGTDG